eukprot:SAG22_NODE_14597_length_370_cov_1.129151_1_plen_57_part_10
MHAGRGERDRAAPTNRRRDVTSPDNPLFRDTPGAMRVTALLFLFSLCVQMTAVCAGE